jgi:plastocyanin
MKKHAPLLTLAAALAAAACGDRPSETPAAAARANAAPRVIEVELVTDEKGNYFEPAEITARTGDVLRLRLVSGVHNLSFPAARNPAPPDQNGRRACESAKAEKAGTGRRVASPGIWGPARLYGGTTRRRPGWRSLPSEPSSLARATMKSLGV